MKRLLFMAGILFFFITMLLFPQPVFDGASRGLLLWFQTVLPSLLPFIIICNLLIKTSAAASISRLTGPLLSRIFTVSSYGSFAVLTGFLCGYPMGAKVTADLLKSGHISKKEGQYLLSFCNNLSPMFILSYIVIHNLKNENLSIITLVLMFLSPILCSFLFRRYYRIEKTNQPDAGRMTSSRFSSRVIDDSIMNGFETITKIGGYIMLFSIVLSLASMLPFSHPLVTNLLLPSLEITNGIELLSSGTLTPAVSFISILALASFGGWCAAAQTQCMLDGTGLKLLPYIVQKLITALVTSLLAILFIWFAP